MPGSISQGLVFEIRDRLNDLDKKLIRNDTHIYKSLSEYQSEFMTMFHTTTQEFEHNVALNIVDGETVELDLDPRFLRLKSWRHNDISIDSTDDIEFSFDMARRKIIVDYSVTATKLYIKAFIMPASHLPDDGGTTPVSDDITKDYDPIIGLGQGESIQKRFYALLRDAVLSEYSTKQRPFKSMDVIYQKVQMLADEIQGAN